MNKKHIEAILIIIVFAVITKVSAQGVSALTEITFEDDTITVHGGGAQAEGQTLTITEAGSYHLSGTLTAGQVIVNAADTAEINLILSDVNISNAQVPPILIENAQSTLITLAEGSLNTLTYTAPVVEDGPNAALYSRNDLSLNGLGELRIEASANDGIRSKAALTLDEAPIIHVNAGDDAIQADTLLTVNNGTLHLVTAGGINGTPNDDLSAKGLKSDEDIIINGGEITIETLDDAIHADQNATINGGTLTLSAIGKAVNIEYELVINGGTLNILTSDEGLEAGFITINDGYVNITALDDGINISEPDDIPNTSLYYLYIHGGVVVISAEGDGIDSNGSIEMTDGLVIVNGPTGSGDGAIDYDGIFDIHGGTLIAVGSAGMPAAPGQGSSQYSLLANFENALEAGTLVNLQSADGESLFTFAPTKTFQSVVFSSPQLREGNTYHLYYGGTVDGSATDGLYTDGTYTTGTEEASFTLSETLTQIGEIRGFRGRGGSPFGGGDRPMGPFGGGERPEGPPPGENPPPDTNN